MRIAVLAGLSDKKLAQKLAPLQAQERITRIDLFRRQPYTGDKIRWRWIPPIVRHSTALGDLWRFAVLMCTAWRYDLVIACHQEMHGVMARIARLLWRRPTIQMVISNTLSIYERPLLRWAMMASDGATVRGVRTEAQLRGVGYDAPIESIANPYTPPPDDAVPTHAERDRDAEYDLIAVASYSREKGYHWLLETLAALTQRRGRTTLAIVGGGPYEAHLGPRIDRLGLRDAITFLGWQDEDGLRAAYRRARAFVLTSYTEGLPQVALEAMAMRLPVFAPAVGEIPWLLTDDVDGRLFYFGDVDGLTTALEHSLADPATRERLGDAGRARLEALLPTFTDDAIADAWRRLLAAVLPE